MCQDFGWLSFWQLLTFTYQADCADDVVGACGAPLQVYSTLQVNI